MTAPSGGSSLAGSWKSLPDAVESRPVMRVQTDAAVSEWQINHRSLEDSGGQRKRLISFDFGIPKI